MRGRKHRRVLSGAADAGRPGESLVAGAVEIGDAAEAAPARNRNKRLEAAVSAMRVSRLTLSQVG